MASLSALRFCVSFLKQKGHCKRGWEELIPTGVTGRVLSGPAALGGVSGYPFDRLLWPQLEAFRFFHVNFLLLLCSPAVLTALQ